MNVIDVLKVGLIKIKAGWCQNAYAKNAQGYICNMCAVENEAEYNPEAACFCAAGAVLDHTQAVRELQKTAYPNMTEREYIATWNDQEGRTQQEVVELYEQTIARLESVTA
jgi:hypothetical protein